MGEVELVLGEPVADLCENFVCWVVIWSDSDDLNLIRINKVDVCEENVLDFVLDCNNTDVLKFER